MRIRCGAIAVTVLASMVLAACSSTGSSQPAVTTTTATVPRSTTSTTISSAAAELVYLRDGWLNPPGLDPVELSKRTLTNLYNARPTWLEHAHAALDRAVLAAYGWPDDLAGEPLLAALLALNLERDPA